MIDTIGMNICNGAKCTLSSGESNFLIRWEIHPKIVSQVTLLGIQLDHRRNNKRDEYRW